MIIIYAQYLFSPFLTFYLFDRHSSSLSSHLRFSTLVSILLSDIPLNHHLVPAFPKTFTSYGIVSILQLVFPACLSWRHILDYSIGKVHGTIMKKKMHNIYIYIYTWHYNEKGNAQYIYYEYHTI